MCGEGRACACLAMSVHVRRVFRSWRRFVFRFLLPVCRSASRRVVSLPARLSLSDFLSVFLSVCQLSFHSFVLLSLLLSVARIICRLVFLSFGLAVFPAFRGVSRDGPHPFAWQRSGMCLLLRAAMYQPAGTAVVVPGRVFQARLHFSSECFSCYLASPFRATLSF